MNDIGAIYARISRRLHVVGLAPSKASNLAGRPDAIRNLKRAVEEKARNPQSNREGMSTATVTALAPVLKTTPEWILSGSGPEEPETSTGSTVTGPYETSVAKVVGVVQAGVWTEFEDFEDQALDGAEVPHHPGKWAHLPQYSFAVRGKSMDQAPILDGDYIICVNYFDARGDLQDGDIVVIERRQGTKVERSVKQLQVVGKELHFCPRSSDPRFLPIIVKPGRTLVEADNTQLRVLALVIGTWHSF